MKNRGFMDNRKVNDNHQEGIKRVMNIGKEMKKGQGGKMSQKPNEHANWKREGSLTPRKA